jgi:hypothetical protein
MFNDAKLPIPSSCRMPGEGECINQNGQLTNPCCEGYCCVSGSACNLPSGGNGCVPCDPSWPTL